jgi:hypothetical protein
VGTLTRATDKVRGRTLKVGFPASNASSFFARAMRCFSVSFARRGFFSLAFPETLERVFLPRFNGRFLFCIGSSHLVVVYCKLGGWWLFRHWFAPKRQWLPVNGPAQRVDQVSWFQLADSNLA